MTAVDSPVTWLLEDGVFDANHDALAEAVRAAGHRVVRVSDERGTPPVEGPAIFHGSLENAARIASVEPWLRPGAFCDVAAFACSAWYPRAAKWLLNDEWSLTTVAALVADPLAVTAERRHDEAFFVRPDSPLKPFAGRVLLASAVSLAALDHGFYYDDVSLPIVVAPVRTVTREWRYVIVDREVVAGSRYEADGRTQLPDDAGGDAWRFAATIAAELAPPEAVYVLDVCESDRGLRLLELNPWSGADLYACDPRSVVDAVSRVVARLAR